MIRQRAARRSNTRRRIFPAVGVLLVGVTIAIGTTCGPAVAHGVEKALVRTLAGGISGSVTYKSISNGKTVGQQSVGVVGEGEISGKLSLDAKLAALVVGAAKGIPLTQIAKGGSYVTRYDIAANGEYKGLLVITFASRGVGSLCLSFDTRYGKFTPGKDYVPSASTFRSVGGTGSIARVHVAGQVTQGEVTGSAIEQILAHGSISSVTVGAATAPDTACAAVSKLAR